MNVYTGGGDKGEQPSAAYAGSQILSRAELRRLRQAVELDGSRHELGTLCNRYPVDDIALHQYERTGNFTVIVC